MDMLNGHKTVPSIFKEVINIALEGDFWEKNDSNDLINMLLENSYLRADLLEQTGRIIKDIMNNIQLTDELCARVNDETYDFIKEYVNDHD